MGLAEAAPARPSQPRPDAVDLGYEPIDVFRTYEQYLARAQNFLARDKLAAAAAYAGLAAHMALRPHPGFFASPRLERLLNEIGRRTAKTSAYRRIDDPRRQIRTILHVATELTPVGGLTNMLGRWVNADTKRMHSLALTGHRGSLHGQVGPAIEASGGRVFRLNSSIGSLIEWAGKLSELARQYDAVVLHTYGQDVVPSLAFANPAKTPPVMLLNHGDHLFWLGVSTSDVVINLRDAAQDLSIARRGVEPRRNVMVPTIVAPAVRTRSREEAKRALGLAADTVLLFSAARAIKYRTVDGRTYADTHVELLKRHPNAQLWVLGANDPADWRPACEAVGGRIKPLHESPDTKTYYEAADIYVDSFPFVSSTSMMEAAGLGVPLVSRFYGPKEARIFAINHPGIDAPTLHGSTEAEYLAQLDTLIADPALRAEKGEEARKSVLHYHTPPDWLDFIERAYDLALSLPPINPAIHLAGMPDESFSNGEPDCRLHEVFGYDQRETRKVLKAHVGVMPTAERLHFWNELREAGAFDSGREMLRALLPDWVVRAIKD